MTEVLTHEPLQSPEADFVLWETELSTSGSEGEIAVAGLFQLNYEFVVSK